MVLTIDTSLQDAIEISLSKGGKRWRRHASAPRLQAEKLLPMIENFLSAKGLKWKEIKEIRVAASGGSFTSLRIGVLTANALAYALGVPAKNRDTGQSFSYVGGQAVKPVYGAEPNIGKSSFPTC